MEFDVTNLDKVQLIQTLYVHADPVGYGNKEYNFREAHGENVIGLTEEECKVILMKDKPNRTEPLIDYLKGKPIKLNFNHKKNNQILVNSSGYDTRNGRYRFLEALLAVFNFDEIIITRKGYPSHLEGMLKEYTLRTQEETQLLANTLKKTIKYNDKGIYWKFDADKFNYTPPFMRNL